MSRRKTTVGARKRSRGLDPGTRERESQREFGSSPPEGFEPMPSEKKAARRDSSPVDLGIGSRSQFADPLRPVPGVQPHGLLVVPPRGGSGYCSSGESAFRGHRLATDRRRTMETDHRPDPRLVLPRSWVSYRETPRGVDVLAVGLDEIGRLMQSGLSQEDLLSIRTRQI